MNLYEQYQTAEHSLGECMINHAVAIMSSWAKELDYDAYEPRLSELVENYKQLFEWFLAQEDPQRDELLLQLTGKAYKLLDELFAKMCARNGISYTPDKELEELIENVDWEHPERCTGPRIADLREEVVRTLSTIWAAVSSSMPS